MDGATLPGAPDGNGDDPRIVCHVDMDCFYASCERLREPALAGEPVVVGMGYEPGEGHGAVATASYEAREYGVESAQPISQALDRLPRMGDGPDDLDVDPGDAGYYRPVDMEFYRAVAASVKEILHDCADVVREVSIDEAYLDVTDRTAWAVVDGDGGGPNVSREPGRGTHPDGPTDGTVGRRTLAEGYARHVKDRIAREVGVPASVGVAPNMSTAKIASDHDKPDGLVVVRPDEVREFLAPLPVEAIHGVGPVSARELADMGVETAGDLAAADPATLRERFGKRGPALGRRARGEDDREVEPTGRPKSLNRESAFQSATDGADAKREKVRALAADVADRARSRGALYRTIGIKVVRPPFDVNTRERSLPGPVDEPDLVEEVALDLLTEFDDDEVRKLGVRVSKLSFAGGDQSSLDGWERDGEGRAGSDAASRPGLERAGGDGGTRADEGVTLTDFEGGATGDPGAVPERETDGDSDADGQASLGDFE
jgi:DNA polymerase IV (DinB-like DNA polymerase)